MNQGFALKAMRMDRRERYQTVREFWAAWKKAFS